MLPLVLLLLKKIAINFAFVHIYIQTPSLQILARCVDHHFTAVCTCHSHIYIPPTLSHSAWGTGYQSDQHQDCECTYNTEIYIIMIVTTMSGVCMCMYVCAYLLVYSYLPLKAFKTRVWTLHLWHEKLRIIKTIPSYYIWYIECILLSSNENSFTCAFHNIC